MDQITITAPDDWHCHLRENEYLLRTVNDTAARFTRAIVMPNLQTPITSVEQAQKYHAQILAANKTNSQFTPLMTLYLTESMAPKTIAQAKQSQIIVACKLYPAGATTHSAKGINKIESIYPILEAMQEQDLVLCIHGESIDPSVDIFDREQRFIDDTLIHLIEKFPRLRIVLEHISTAYAADFIAHAPSNVAATITAHHLLFNRNEIFHGGVRPHYYCLPILKRETDRQALVSAACSGNSKFFLGSDSAPHAKNRKETSCGCAGIYTAHAAIELYAQVFAQQNKLSHLEAFASHNGANFYGLPINQHKITLQHQPWRVPATLTFGEQELIPLFADAMIEWRLQGLAHG